MRQLLGISGGMQTDILDNYTDANGNVDINAAVNDGAMNNLGTYTDPNSGQSQTVYGDNGVMNEDQMVNSGANKTFVIDWNMGDVRLGKYCSIQESRWSILQGFMKMKYSR